MNAKKEEILMNTKNEEEEMNTNKIVKATMVHKKPDESTVEKTVETVKKAPHKRKATTKAKAKAKTVKVKAAEPADKQAEEMFKSCEVDGASSEILGKTVAPEAAEKAVEATPEEVDKAAKEAEKVFDKCETQNADEEIVKTDDEAETTPNGAQFTDIEDKNLDAKMAEDEDDPFVKAISDIGSTAKDNQDDEISDDDVDGLDDILDDIDDDLDEDDGLSADDMVDNMTDDELLDMIGEDPDMPADIEDLNGPIDKIDVKLSVPVTRVSNNGSTVRLFLDSENVWIVEVYLGAHRELRQKYDDDTTDVVNIDFTDNAVVINMPHGMKTLIKVYHADEE